MTVVKLKDSQRYSFLMIPKALFKKKPSFKAILTYVALRYYAHNGSESCERISIKTLAAIVNQSDKTIQRGLAELEKLGILRTHHRTRKSPSGARIPLPNLYELLNLQSDEPDSI